MILIDGASYFFKELFDLLMLFMLIALLTDIHQKSFYFALFLFLFPLVLLSVTDALLTGLVLSTFVVMLRFKTWRKNGKRKFSEIFGLLLSLAIYSIVPLFSSMLVSKSLGLHFNVLNADNPLLVPFLIGIDWFLSIVIAFILKSKVIERSIPIENVKIYCLQLGVFLTFVYLFGEILRRMQVLGIFQIVMVSFLVAQFSVTIFMTYLKLKKNQEKAELSSLRAQMVVMNTYTAEIERNYQELRKFRHDYKNMLLALKTTQTGSSINEDYLNQVIDYSHQMIDHSVMRFSGLSNLKISPIKSLLVVKLAHAEQLGLKVNFECLVPLTKINLDEVKLVRILGILIDNAVEAALGSDAGIVTIILIATRETIEISIENSFQGKLPSLSAMKREGYSNKGKDRGLGLSNIQAILASNKQVDLSHYSNQGLFVSVLTIGKGESV
ncbi:GHKL domain-containing protein [Lapidilactobacillus achengensis]|uniref:GHKL domain-containing protein n=1 Tax=Lapidilactobacillus achengensis TaxID=2486000 RepID=A0ABW1UTL6_9LACO|nr:GHKL domain-containing protein [Lapidilactobacillus achengensis]